MNLNKRTTIYSYSDIITVTFCYTYTVLKNTYDTDNKILHRNYLQNIFIIQVLN